jgi:hypothetical protein
MYFKKLTPTSVTWTITVPNRHVYASGYVRHLLAMLWHEVKGHGGRI